MSLWVADTSPLIFLAKLNRLDLLRKGAEEILVPPAVLGEIAEQDDEATLRIEEAQRTWLQVRPVKDLRLSTMLKRELGDGEAEAIVLALETKAARIVLDDLDARRLADQLGLKPVGTWASSSRPSCGARFRPFVPRLIDSAVEDSAPPRHWSRKSCGLEARKTGTAEPRRPGQISPIRPIRLI